LQVVHESGTSSAVAALQTAGAGRLVAGGWLGRSCRSKPKAKNPRKEEKSNRVTSQLSTMFQSVLLYVRDRRETAAGHQLST
jgi:hypothetical protein